MAYSMNILNRLAATLPASCQNELRRSRYRRQVKKDLFATSEPEPSDRCGVAAADIPGFETGLKNLYQAHLISVDSRLSDLQVLTLRLDALEMPRKVDLVKIGVEGHELAVLRGMMELLRRDHPTLIVETSSDDVIGLLAGLGHATEQLAGSPNRLFRPTSLQTI
jgi:FkbM family methyltransferase